jgi:hypothetical protein
MSKYILSIMFIITICVKLFSQDYNSEKTTLSNFIKRMYISHPFTGVKVFEDYENNYLVSVVLLDKSKYTSSATMNRVAQVKAQSQTSTFLNGSHIEMDFIITTKEKRSEKAEEVTVETIERIKESGVGFVNAIELLTNFDSEKEEGKMVFVFIKKIESE